jgi:hypothetical protein
MTREEFLGAEQEPWWLLQRDLTSDIEVLRVRLGQTQGWVDPLWYTEHDKLEELYRLLDEGGPILLSELDQAIDDDRRRRWVESVIEHLRPSGGPHGDSDGVAYGGSPLSVPIDQRVQSVLSGLSVEDVATLAAEFNASPQVVGAILRDPEFERSVLEEAARLASGAV